MPNTNPKQENHYHFKQKRNNPTKTIRVPENFADELLAIARQFDNGSCQTLTEILKKIENKEKGYRINSASQLIKDLKALITVSGD